MLGKITLMTIFGGDDHEGHGDQCDGHADYYIDSERLAEEYGADGDGCYRLEDSEHRCFGGADHAGRNRQCQK